MIISVSYKTDIPAFYSQWFLNRLQAGYCKAVNSYGKQIYRIDLRKDAVDGFIFWTKNIAPFLDVLKEVRQREFPFIIQYTINQYPRILETSVVEPKKSIEHMKLLADSFGEKIAVWRYDTVILSSLTPYAFHLENFERLAKALRGTTDEVVISFAQIYRKTLRNMNAAAEKYGFTWEDPSNSVKLKLASELAQIAKTFNMQLTMCSQPEYLAPGVAEAHCVDIDRLSIIAGHPIFAKLKGNRKGCACYQSIDIGEYDTCPHGCVYCYAVQNRENVIKNFKIHNPESEFLVEPKGYISDLTPQQPIQGRLF